MDIDLGSFLAGFSAGITAIISIIMLIDVRKAKE